MKINLYLLDEKLIKQDKSLSEIINFSDHNNFPKNISFKKINKISDIADADDIKKEKKVK